MMSQGINVVLAKTLLNIECKQNQTIAAMDAAWEEKLHNLKLEYDTKIESQTTEMKSLHEELQQLKEFIHGKQQCEFGTNPCHAEELKHAVIFVDNVMEQTYGNLNMVELEGKNKTNQKVKELEEITSAVQDFMEDFVKLYECRNGVVDYVITKHENDLKTSRDTICAVDEKVELFSKMLSSMESKFIHHVELFPLKLDGYVEDLKRSNETYVSVDEHNQLRMNLEAQILECDMKCDHALLTAQQQWEEYKYRSDEVEVVKGVLTRAKKRRELALSQIQSKCHILTEIMENESKTCDSYENMVRADPITKNTSLHLDDSRKVHFVVEIDEPHYDGLSENTTSTLRYEIEDNESEFGNSVSLIFLDEHSIQ